MVGMEIGYFGDERLRSNGELIAQRVVERQAVCLRKLGDDRAEQVKFRRFLSNDAVTVEEMVAHRALLAAAASVGRHVLAIQDTSELNYQAQRGRKRGLGKVGNGTDVGLFVHPVLGVDAGTGACLGLIDAQVWRRRKRKAANYRKQKIEKKESYRWLRGGKQAKAVLAGASMVTIIDDREGDIYEKWARLPDERTQLLTRAAQDRGITHQADLLSVLNSAQGFHPSASTLKPHGGAGMLAEGAELGHGDAVVFECADLLSLPRLEVFADGDGQRSAHDFYTGRANLFTSLNCESAVGE